MTDTERHNKEILARYLPQSAVEPIFDFLNANQVHFHITRQRASKLGDYRMPQLRHPYHEISVNGDLTPHMFLLVLLHEMAHLNTYLRYQRSVQPHGHEWQQQYRDFLVSYFNAGHFPEETRTLFAKYTSRIPLNRAAGTELEQRLREIDNPEAVKSALKLKELAAGTCFILNNGQKMVLRIQEKLRTRYKCKEVFTGRLYSVSGNADVTVVPEELLSNVKEIFKL